jgi:spermidine synthase
MCCIYFLIDDRMLTWLSSVVSVFQPSFDNSFDVVLSDMAPATSGIKTLDTSASHELCEHAFHIAQRVLKPNGTLVMVSENIFTNTDMIIPGSVCTLNDVETAYTTTAHIHGAQPVI